MAPDRLVPLWRWLALFLSLTALSLTFLAYRDRQQFGAALDQQLTRMDTRLDQANQLLQRAITESGRDAVSLADLASMATALSDGLEYGAARSALRRTIELHRNYMQTRLLDNNGQERIRFNRYHDSVVEARGAQLQNKAHRYYIDAARDLDLGQLYVSPIDLNIEHGEIERPLRPVLRLAAPIATGSDTIAGFAIINYDMTPLFNELLALFEGEIGDLLAAKPNGVWMLAPDPSLHWGEQLGHDARFDASYPEAWRQALRRDRGTARTPEGWFSFRRAALSIGPEVTITGQPTLGWLFIRVPPERLAWQPLRKAWDERNALLVLLGTIAAIAFAITGLWVRLTRAQRRHAANLRSLKLAGVIYDNADEALFVTDTEQRIESVNDAATRITGYSKRDLIGATPRLWRSGRHDQTFYERLWRDIERDGQWSGEIINRRKDGELFPAWESITAVHGENGEALNYVAVMTDISALKIAEDQLRHLAFHDPLSGLPNRMLFTNNLEQLVELCRRSNERFAVAVIDLDHFKVVNDSLGHHAGDELIKAVARRLKQGSRAEDTVARLGGDEFAIIMPGIDSPETVAAVMRRTLTSVTQPFELEGRIVQPECSAGLALFPDDGDSPTDLFKAADAAMYESKRRRKHELIFHSPELQARADTRMELEHSLRRALDRDELELRYQPQVDIASGRVLGAEALVRWQHPQRGLVLPAEFIPIAEESALINRVGAWVAAKVRAQAERWATAGLVPLRIAINISPHQLNNRHGRDALFESLGLAGDARPPCRIDLELTETHFFDSAEAIGFLNMLRNRGISITMDKFGAGRSSLLQLSRLPIDRIKVSGELVRVMDTDAGARAIVRAVLELSRDLGRVAAAENVESDAQRDALLELGCREGQGYLFGEPMTAAEFADVFRATVSGSAPQPTRADD